jgi:hypothetical protein
VTTGLGIALAGVRPSEIVDLCESVVPDLEPTDVVQVVFQGDSADYAELSRALGPPVRLLHDSGRGAPRARNLAVRNLPDQIDWIWTPNDTTRPTTGFVRGVKAAAADAPPDCGALAVNYAIDANLRRHVSETPELTGWSLWRAIEPATLWRFDAFCEAGGFDERIGTGSAGLAQAGAGTDLLCRLSAAGWRTRTVDLQVDGHPQRVRADLRIRRQLAKEFGYSVGYALVARRHFGFWRSAIRIPGPLANFVLRRTYEGAAPRLGECAVACLGRATGTVLGETASRVPMPAPRRRASPGVAGGS